jgi:subtilisin-like proprotein convertase family protein
MKRSATGALVACASFAVFAIAGTSPAVAKTKTATKTVCTPVNVGVPTDPHTTVSIPFSLGKLPKGATIVHVSPQLRITQQQAYVNALVASPAGRMALLGNGDSQSGNGDDWGTGPACAGTPTTFDDQASTPFFHSSAPFAGTFRPLSPLSELNGGPAAGTWRFFVDDLGGTASRPITVNSVGAIVVYRYKVKKKKKKSKKSAAAKAAIRTGTFDTCVNSNLAVTNGPGDDTATLGGVPIATGKLPRRARITDVDARIRMSHTYEGDLEFYLASPSGAIDPLWIGRNESNNDFGDGSTDCNGNPTVFDDEAATSILDGTSPYAGSFRPLYPLSSLDGGFAAGTWTLYVEDHYTEDQGVLHSVGLKVDYQYRVKKKKKHKK